jgi:hypothetical protein
MKNKSNVGIITEPIGNAGVKPLNNLVDILDSIFNKTYIITGNEGYDYYRSNSYFTCYGVYYQASNSVLLRVINQLVLQIKYSLRIILLRKKIDHWFFFIGGDSLILPAITTKCMGKKVILISAGSGARVAKINKDVLFFITLIANKFTHNLFDKLIVYSANLIEDAALRNTAIKSP